jgi:hypothetical protein
MPHRSLDSVCVIDTIDRLERRIGARFPEAGLRRVCVGLAATARRCASEAERLRKPQRWIRASVYSVWVAGAGAFSWVASALRFDGVSLSAASFVQILEPSMNIAVLVGLGVLGLARLEERWKRARAIAYLHELRSIAHVVDMHQLTKDPYREFAPLPDTEHSPKHTIVGPHLERYLDYCSEMLALVAKLAALLAQSCRDNEVAAAASDVETLTTGLSRKIWQKIALMPRSA